MNFQDLSSLFGSRRHRKPGKSFVSRKAIRRLFLESLESRQLLAVAPIDGDDEIPISGFEGNYFPQTRYRSGADGALTAGAAGDPLTIGINYLRANASAFGLTSGDLADGRYRVTSRSTAPDTGTTSIYLQQMYNGLPVADAVANLSILRDGRIMAAGANFVAGLQHAPTFPSPMPLLSALEAVSTFASASNVGLESDPTITTPPTGFNKKTVLSEPELSQDPINAELQYVPKASGGVELAWRFQVRSPGNIHMYDTAIAASGGRTGQVTRVVDAVRHASYNVLPRPVQDPNFGNFSIVVNPHNPATSPFGWHDINGIPGAEFLDTRGNNVFAQEDTDGNDVGGMRPTGGPTLDFIAPIDFTMAPAFNQFAGLINAFYWVNLAHDVTAQHGFDEASGNFQVTNYSGQGFGGDQVILDTQDPLALNNAFFLPTPEGVSPRLTMGIWTSTIPARDSSFGNDVLAHEYFHGVTDRLVAGPADIASLNAIQSGGLAEGWSDWFGMLMTSSPSHNANTPRTVANWPDGQGAAGPGIRRVPYSVDMSIDPRTFRDYNGDGIPGFNNSEVHNAGEIWASVLWDMTWALTNKYGRSTDLITGTGGNVLSLKLVIDSLKLLPLNPSFLQARDAIISADFARTGGENFELVWSVFARRGMGRSAVDGFDSRSLAVNAGFDVPPGPARVHGVVFQDNNSSLTRDPNEGPLVGWTIYADANSNGALDAGERRTLTQADGSYTLAVFQSGFVDIRQVVQANYTQTLPQGNGARRLNLVRGQTFFAQNFGNQPRPGEIRGVVWNDIDSDGVRDAGEPGLANLVVFVDLNNDGRVNLLEPSALTDNFGRYTIKNVPPGTYTVRVAFQPGTVPGATTDHTVTVGASQVMTGIDFPFGQSQFDYGDAPASYATLRSSNGARHGLLAGFHLGALIDIESDGQPNATATGDDTNPLPPDPVPVPPPPSPDDEDGVVFLQGGVTPGFPSSVQVTVNNGAFFPGRLHAWVDLNRDGDFLDTGEKVIAGVTLATGVHNVTFTAPAGGALGGSTFARFRYGYEPNLGPTGTAVAGEVEDYQVNLLANVPIAAPDAFTVKQGTIDAPLDVLANDTTTTFGPPQIVPGSFPSSLPSGSTLRLNTAGNRILFTPGQFSFGPESFTYRVTDGNSISAPGQVTVNVTIRDPLAVDDTVTIPFTATPAQTQINPLANDIFPFANTIIVSTRKVTQDAATGPASLVINPGGASLTFTPPVGFKGTIIYEYTISDADPSTSDATGLLTIQVVDVVAGVPVPDAANYSAELSIQILDPTTGLPIQAVNVGQEFLARVFSRDLRPGGSDINRGVEAAYLDLIFNRDLVEPVLTAANPRGFAITYDTNPPSPPGPAGPTTYSASQSGTANSPAPGQIDEVGALHLPLVTPDSVVHGLGPGTFAVFTVRMRAKAATPAGQPVQIFGSHAEEPNDVIVMPNDPTVDPAPIELADERVFLAASTPLSIVGIGEAEFTNYFEPLDVDGDFSVSPIDAVLIINELNSAGSHALSPIDYASKGFLRPTNMLDVTMDSFVSPIDAVTVINHLNAQAALLASSQSMAAAAVPAAPLSAGEGEADMLLEGDAADANDIATLALLISAEAPETASAPAASAVGELPEDQVMQTTAAAATPRADQAADAPLFRSRFTSVDTAAADELFTSFGLID